MVIRLPGTGGREVKFGPQPGPNPAWARFTRTPSTKVQPSTLSIKAYKPDVAGYRLLGAERTHEPQTVERNRHNSSVYVSHAARAAARPGSSASRLPVIGEIAAGQYDVTVAFQEYDCLDHENGVAVDKALAKEAHTPSACAVHP